MALALGEQTGSMMNNIMSRQTKGQPEPVVGMGATLLGWTDRYAATVIAVAGGVVTVQEDHAVRSDANGMSDAQDYTYSRNPEGLTYHFRFRDGAWEAVEFNDRTKRWNKRDGYGLKIGVRSHYYDYSF